MQGWGGPLPVLLTLRGKEPFSRRGLFRTRFASGMPDPKRLCVDGVLYFPLPETDNK
jgi:hypothetical protein